MEQLIKFTSERPLSRSLIIVAVQIAVISALLSFYDVEVPFRAILERSKQRMYKVPFIRNSVERIENYLNHYFHIATRQRSRSQIEISGNGKAETNSKNNNANRGGNPLPVFTSDQMALFDGTRQSKPVYLALLGRVFDVDKGRKHYGQGGSYHAFAGKDATRAFVTGDFSAQGLTADVSGLAENELLSVKDWITFYEKEYRLVGFLEGIYYDKNGQPTELLNEINRQMENALLWKEKQLRQSEVFPPCNSEWKKNQGGRVWCTNKSGGVNRDWVGVPRKLFNPGAKDHRCVCVKNFGPSLSQPELTTNRGDLDNPNLLEYEDCPPASNSCAVQH